VVNNVIWLTATCFAAGEEGEGDGIPWSQLELLWEAISIKWSKISRSTCWYYH